jgi:hypothetical protein
MPIEKILKGSTDIGWCIITYQRYQAQIQNGYTAAVVIFDDNSSIENVDDALAAVIANSGTEQPGDVAYVEGMNAEYFFLYEDRAIVKRATHKGDPVYKILKGSNVVFHQQLGDGMKFGLWRNTRTYTSITWNYYNEGPTFNVNMYLEAAQGSTPSDNTVLNTTPITNVAAASNRTFEKSGLRSGTSYTAKAISVINGNADVMSTVPSVHTDSTLSAAPLATLVSRTRYSVTFSFFNRTQYDFDLVRAGTTSPGGTDLNQSVDHNSGVTKNYTLESLSPGTSYTIYSRGQRKGTSLWEQANSFTVTTPTHTWSYLGTSGYTPDLAYGVEKSGSCPNSGEAAAVLPSANNFSAGTIAVVNAYVTQFPDDPCNTYYFIVSSNE